jgi:hypothetical protein
LQTLFFSRSCRLFHCLMSHFVAHACRQMEQEQDKSYAAGAQSQMSVRRTCCLYILAAFPHVKLFLLTPPCAGADERERAASGGHAADGEGAERRARCSRGTQFTPFLL